MTMTMTPGSVALTAGAVTCASTLATATAMPAGKPHQLGHRRRELARFRSQLGKLSPHFLVDDILKRLGPERENNRGWGSLRLAP